MLDKRNKCENEDIAINFAMILRSCSPDHCRGNVVLPLRCLCDGIAMELLCRCNVDAKKYGQLRDSGTTTTVGDIFDFLYLKIAVLKPMNSHSTLVTVPQLQSPHTEHDVRAAVCI